MIDELRNFRQRPCLKAAEQGRCRRSGCYCAMAGLLQRATGRCGGGTVVPQTRRWRKSPALAQKLAPHRNDEVKPLRLMIMGIPNVGKSTLMNAWSNAALPTSATSRR